ncbi:MAG: anhydro-N-acetylmuramic acid kinase [Gallionella sp.]|nr:anhydro-N-acetylmuramic acid kinase [Gallionella sp.]
MEPLAIRLDHQKTVAKPLVIPQAVEGDAASLREYHINHHVQHPQELYIGLMSGTSLDGIDAALVDLGQPKPVQLAKHYLPFDDALRNALLSLHQPSHNELHQAQLVGNQLARLYAAAVNALLTKAGLHNNFPLPLDVTTSHSTRLPNAGSQVAGYAGEGLGERVIKAIGCHGQTIRHCPEHGYTLQIGNAALLAELTGITVVSDFRSRDIAAGGQGAPLVPAFHDKVMRHPAIHRVIVNIGGISNLTSLPPNATTSGFDCGPGNLLMDAWCMQHLGKPYDDNGAWAASGKVLPALLEKMLNEPFFSQPPPRSSGRDLFNLSWLQDKLKGNEAAEDVQATLLELTSRAITQSIQQHCPGAKEVYLCGGGAHNQTLHNRLAALLPDCSVRTTDALGVDGEYLEATAFAWLAQQNLQGEPANLPLVTGAKHPCILGAVYRHS